MASKDDRDEAAVNARIAAIRAKNEARERRHREVEADRLEAEKNKSAVSLKVAASDQPEDFKNPFPNENNAASTNKKKPVHERVQQSKTTRTDQDKHNLQGRRGRLADDDGPPPDPGYSFLADRMRDASPDEDEDDQVQPERRNKNQPPSRNQQQTRNRKEPLANKKSGSGRDYRDENVSPKHRMANKSGNRIEERVAQNIREIRDETSRSSKASSSAPESRSKPGPAQARLERSRNNQQVQQQQQHQQPKENGNNDNFPVEAWKCPDPGCGYNNRPRMMRCVKCSLEWSSALLFNPNRKVIESKKNITVKVQFDRSNDQQQKSPEHEHLKELQQPSSGLSQPPSNQQPPPSALTQQPPQQPPQPTPLVASTPSWTPNDNSQAWQAMPINQWDSQATAAAQPQSQQMVIGHWENPGMSWTPQMAPHHPHGHHEWTPADQSGQDYYQHPAPYAMHHISYQEPSNPLMIPIGSHPDYMTHPPLVHHGHHQAMTNITHATMPIMATQQYIPPAPKDSYYRSSSYRPSTNGRGGGGSRSWNSNPDKEVTRIPPRFQKQRPVHQHQASEKAQGLPRATSTKAPVSAKRLTIFGTSNVVNNLNESELSEALNIPVRLVPAMKLEVFKEKIAMVDPLEDRIVLIHGLGNDARNIALHSTKTDVDKGAESDGLANEFADVVLDLIERIPYIKVLISTLLPRFDNEEQMNMSNPNNVRKVMNVEISMRLQDKASIEFINNDTVLEWWKDDVKKMRLFRADGYHLSAYGFSMMLEHWMKTLKSSVSKLGLSSDEDSCSPDAEDDSTVQISPKMTSIAVEASSTSSSSAEKEPQLVSDNELPALEEVTPKMANVTIKDEVPPLPPAASTASEEEEFHEASESPVEPPAQKEATEEPSAVLKEEEDFKEKSNEEKMEKEMKNEDG